MIRMLSAASSTDRFFVSAVMPPLAAIGALDGTPCTPLSARIVRSTTCCGMRVLISPASSMNLVECPTWRATHVK